MANFAELRLFGKALRNTNESPRTTINSGFIQECAAKGYIIHPDCNHERVMSYILTLPHNLNSTFYKSFNDVINRSREALWLDQCMHYASTYGTGHTGTAYVPNDNPAQIDFTDCKVIQPITLSEIEMGVQDILYSGIALKSNTLDDVFELIEDFEIDIDLDQVKNREAIIRYHILKDLPFNTPQETLQAINFLITDSACIVKDRETLNLYSCSGSWDKEFPNIKACFNSHSLEEWASIFNRYKPLFLALRNSELRPAINKISKLSKKHHVPVEMPISTVFLTKEYLSGPKQIKCYDWLTLIIPEVPLINLVKWATAIRKRMHIDQPVTMSQAFHIRNGKSFYKKHTYNLDEEDQYTLNLYHNDIMEEINVRMSKYNGKNFKIPNSISYAMPTSEKNFIGTLPLGSYVDIKPEDNLIVGIHWKDEDGAKDLDLSFTGIDGNIVSWCNSYTDEDSNIVYSGDMTSADPEASECILFRNNIPNGVFKVNAYAANLNSKYTFFVAKHTKNTFGMNHIVDPNDIIFQTSLEMIGKEMSMAVYIDNKFIFTDRAVGSGRVASRCVSDIISSQINESDVQLNLNQILVNNGAKLWDENDPNVPENAIDLTTDDKLALISLLS